MPQAPINAIYLDGQFLAGPALDLTLYPEELTQSDFDSLLELYQAICPADRRTLWKLAEDPLYLPFESGRHGSLSSLEMDRFRQRVASGWRAEFRLWDGHSDESWSFHVYRLPRTLDAPAAAFYRFLLPATAEPSVLRRVAEVVAGSIPILSGHGGYTLLYDGTRLFTAFNHIYAFARRFWGLDVEHLNSTIRLMRQGIKGVSWLTLVGPAFAEKLVGPIAMDTLSGDGVTVASGAGGVVLTAGPAPDRLDQHRRGTVNDTYSRIARSLEPVFLPEFPELPGQFTQEGNSATWFRRFLDPAAWRQ